MSRLPALPWFVDALRERPEYARIGVPVEFGRPTVTQELVTQSQIWIDVQRGDATDSFEAHPLRANRGATPGYLHAYLRRIGCEAVIHGVHPQVGARRQEHVEFVDAIVNDLLWCMYETARELACLLVPTGGGYLLAPGETAELEQGFAENGARYALRFTLAVPIVSAEIERVRIGPAPDVEIVSTHTVPFNGQDWPA